MTAARICKIDDCDNRLRGGAQGWCGKHYQRFVTHGDPLVVGKTGRPRKDYVAPAPVELTIKPLQRDEQGNLRGHCYFNQDAFDAVLDLTVWWTGNRPGAGAQRTIDNAKAICASCPLQLQCRAENRDLTGVVGGEYRPASAIETAVSA